MAYYILAAWAHLVLTPCKAAGICQDLSLLHRVVCLQMQKVGNLTVSSLYDKWRCRARDTVLPAAVPLACACAWPRQSTPLHCNISWHDCAQTHMHDCTSAMTDLRRGPLYAYPCKAEPFSPAVPQQWQTCRASGTPVCMAMRTRSPLNSRACFARDSGVYSSLASVCVSNRRGQGSSSSLCCASSAHETASIGSWKAIVKASPSVATCIERHHRRV